MPFAEETNTPQLPGSSSKPISPSSPSSNSVSRPGSRQRRARWTAAEKEREKMTKEESQQANHWSKAEEEEAISLIKEILSTGITTDQLIKQGFRSDLVELCNKQIFPSPESSTSNISQPAATTQLKAKRKRKKAGSKAKDLNDVVVHDNSLDPNIDPITATTAIPSNELTSDRLSDHLDGQDDQIQYADLLRQKVELERERAKLLRLERQKQANDSDQTGELESSLATSATELDNGQEMNEKENNLSVDPVLAMREAALASMKRKRPIDGPKNEDAFSVKSPRTAGDTTYDSRPLTPFSSLPYSPLPNGGLISPMIYSYPTSARREFQSSTPPINAPRGPKSSLPRYRDIDAPSNMEAIQREIEAAEALQSSEDSDLWATDDSFQIVDPRSALQRSKPLAYYDDVAVPAGQVDYSAPLPSLLPPPPKPSVSLNRSRISPGSFSRQENGMGQPVHQRSIPAASSYMPNPPRRQAPFLQNDTDQRVVLDLSDEDDDDENEGGSDEDSEHVAKRQFQKENAKMMHSIFKSVVNGESPVSMSQSKILSPTVSNTRSLLLNKEREIELLKEKMLLLQQKRKANPDPMETNQNLTESNSFDKQKKSASAPNTASHSLPAYESPFTRYPGLRAMIEKQKSGEKSGQ